MAVSTHADVVLVYSCVLGHPRGREVMRATDDAVHEGRKTDINLEGGYPFIKGVWPSENLC